MCFTWVYFLCVKSNIVTIFHDFFFLIQTQFDVTIKFMHSDNALELSFSEFFYAKGIIPFHSCVETLQQNLVVKHKY